MLSVEAVSARHVLLGLVAAALLIAAVYLFHEVRTSPAVAAESPHHAPAPVPAPRVAPDPEPQARAVAQDHRWSAPSAVHAATSSSPVPTVPSESPSDEDLAALERPDVKLDSYMDAANKAYDRGDWEEAKLIAGKVLNRQATNIRMMRIMVSASCIDGDTSVAQRWFDQLPKLDREQMKVRCDKYGVSFKELPQ